MRAEKVLRIAAKRQLFPAAARGGCSGGSGGIGDATVAAIFALPRLRDRIVPLKVARLANFYSAARFPFAVVFMCIFRIAPWTFKTIARSYALHKQL